MAVHTKLLPEHTVFKHNGVSTYRADNSLIEPTRVQQAQHTHSSALQPDPSHYSPVVPPPPVRSHTWLDQARLGHTRLYRIRCHQTLTRLFGSSRLCHRHYKGAQSNTVLWSRNVHLKLLVVQTKLLPVYTVFSRNGE